MIVRITSGVTGFDEFTAPPDDLGLAQGGIPENTITLLYGPSGTGKSLFCHSFTYQGLSNDEPCLYLTTDQDFSTIYQNMEEMGLSLQEYMEGNMLHVIDASSSEEKLEDSTTYQSSNVKNPTDILVKVNRRIHSLSHNPRFRSVVDSITSILESNDEMLIMRVLKSYILRVKEAGGTAIITYTQGSADPRTEIIIKSMVDNIIRVDGEILFIESMKGLGWKQTPYKITQEGLILREE